MSVSYVVDGVDENVCCTYVASDFCAKAGGMAGGYLLLHPL